MKMSEEYKHIKRNFGPVFDTNSKILILGSFPSVKSREAAFFYGHPQNRFWPLLERLLQCEIPADISGRKELLLKSHIALWDTIEECDIIGSSDSSIKNAVPVDIMKILKVADIQSIYCNGNTSYKLFMKYLFPICNRMPVRLPSTSPANASWTMDKLYEAWASELSALECPFKTLLKMSAPESEIMDPGCSGKNSGIIN